MTADVAVIGGGIVGTAAAAFLAEAGLRVTIYEATEVAAGASGRNSGVVQQPFDGALVGLYRRSLELYRDLAVADPQAFHLDDEPSGLLLIGPESAAAEAANIAGAWAVAYSEARPELVAGPALRSLEPSLADGLAACRLDIGYPVAPASASRAYAALAERLGVRIAIGSASLALEGAMATGVVIDGRHEPAGAVVVAAGPWTPSVLGDVGWPPIGRSWGVVAGLQLERPPRHVLEEIDIDIEPDDGGDDPSPDSGYGFSLVTADGESGLGSTFLPEPPEKGPAGEIFVRLRERGARYVPAIAGIRVAGLRVCARPVSPDGRPLLGRVPGVPNAFIAAGHGPWGISTGPGSARLVADLVLGGTDAVPAALDAARFGGLGQRAPLPG